MQAIFANATGIYRECIKYHQLECFIHRFSIAKITKANVIFIVLELTKFKNILTFQTIFTRNHNLHYNLIVLTT